MLARYNADGTLAWVKTLTGGSSVVASDVAGTADGGALVSGEFVQSLVAGQGEAAETSLYSIAGNLDSFLARFDGSGALQWARNDSTGLPDQGRAVAADGDSAVHVGNFRGSGAFGAGQPGEITLESGGFDDGYVARFDAAGQLLVARQAGGAANQGSTVPAGVAIASDGSAVVVGQYSDSSTFLAGASPVVLTEQGGYDVFVAAWGADGAFLFAESSGGGASDGAQSVAVSTGAAYITGWFGGDSTFTAGDETLSATATGGAEFYLLRRPL